MKSKENSTLIRLTLHSSDDKAALSRKTGSHNMCLFPPQRECIFERSYCSTTMYSEE